MKPAKLNVYFCFLPYGSNGGTQSEHPSIRAWFADTMNKAKADERVGNIDSANHADTPVTMNRNDAVLHARRVGADVLVMCDSDNHPDLYPNKPKFWDEAFTFLYERKMREKATVIGAPYCGPPPDEVCYVFKWTNRQSLHANADIELNMYPRQEAAMMAGIQPCSALPTGLIMFDMEIFEITDPKHEYQRLLDQGHTQKVAESLTKPWFYYEWKDIYQAQKSSTEDVTCTRDMGLICQEKFGYNPLFCAWDCWAGHWKPKCVGKPSLITSDMVNEKYRTAVLESRNSGEEIRHMSGLAALRDRMEGGLIINEGVAANGPPKKEREY